MAPPPPQYGAAHPSAPPHQRSHQPSQQPLNPSTYEYSNPPRLPRIHPASDQHPYPSNSQAHYGPAYQQPPLPPAPPSAQQQQPSSAAGLVRDAQRYGSPHDHSEELPDEQLDSGQSPTDPNDANDSKRSRACESCRSLKVRCDQDAENPDAPCKRCAKAKRQCIITTPSRKRQKKTDSRVAELEKKIDALTATLHERHQPTMASPGGSKARYGPADVSSPDSAPGYSSPNVRGPQPSAPVERNTPRASYPYRDNGDGSGVAQKRRLSESPYDKQHQSQSLRAGSKPMPDSDDKDTLQYVVSALNAKIEDIIDEGTANKMFERYVVEMTVHMPAVVFPRSTTAHQIRTARPILFLSILVAASVGMMPLEPQEQMTELLKATLAECIVRLGGKSIELVQALIIAVTWYRPPKRYEQMNFYQLTHTAAIMAIDIGLGKRIPGWKTGRPQSSAEQSRMPKYLLHSGTAEARRTWLGCYFLCSNTAMTLRRPNLIRWSGYMDECLDVFENSPESTLPTDKLLCQFVRLQHINEEIGQQFSMDDPSATITISDSHVQYALKSFENQLRDWSSGVSATSTWNGQLKFNEYISGVYMHEVALHVNHNIDDFRAPFTEESLRAASGQSVILSSAHSKALSECLTSVHGAFQAFFNMDISTIRALPIFYFVRIAYAVVVLIKLFFAVTAPGSEVGKIISKEDLQVEHHLDTLLRIFHTIEDEESFRPAKMFLVILGKLREWFTANKDNKNIPRDASRFNPWASTQHAEEAARDQKRDVGRETPQSNKPEPGRPMPLSNAAPQFNNSTPLHFLVDVATHGANPNAAALSSNNSPRTRMERSLPTQQHQQPSQPPAMHANPGYVQDASGASMLPAGYDPNAVLENTDFNMGVGFERAMDMTLGAGDTDLSSLFMGDPMFNFGAQMGQEGWVGYPGW